MITIPELAYKDDSLELVLPHLELVLPHLVLPHLELSLDEANQVLRALSDTVWPAVLNTERCICYAFRWYSVDYGGIRDALVRTYNRTSLEGCVYLALARDVSGIELKCIADMVRKAWCRHMRNHLEEALA